MSDPMDKPSQAEGADDEGVEAEATTGPAGGEYDPMDKPSQAEGEDDASAQ
ncbi:hypothetical protein [Microbacterium sp. P04]|uniref:hypothetical protein n=1 Tax=Microbacterium sp. P04 TaxID=3366947 RepID=UPI0037452BF1